MPVCNAESIYPVDAAVLREVLRDVVEGPLRSLVEFDDEEFNVLYADDVTLSFYDSPEHMCDHFEHIHDFVNLDHTEMDLFTGELFPIAERVRYLASGLDLFTMVRIYPDDCAYFVAIDPEEPVAPVVRAVERVVRDG
jgi:DNA polymerase II small subunit/DNA polymerase delta subunit B